MRLLSLIARITVFLLVLLFALANTHSVTLTLVPGVAGLSFEAPMVLWMLAVFTLGVLVAVIFMLPTLVMRKRGTKAAAEASISAGAKHDSAQGRSPIGSE